MDQSACCCSVHVICMDQSAFCCSGSSVEPEIGALPPGLCNHGCLRRKQVGARLISHASSLTCSGTRAPPPSLLGNKVATLLDNADAERNKKMTKSPAGDHDG
ncbi:hypothetical protein F7725_024800 [Dissostichus mawsoni]|uniref:Uncharacterized protein n=1 Tax=Dissostichus mawsoni TaxID=36200 RepID=A0A7J5X9A6_DISMA|nr:hypothetical protein F7725_024800 [Dissostichus mawsoni]